MRSKASIKSHPIHPILISFPIAFLTGTFIADVVAFFTDYDQLWQLAYYLEIAGVVMGVIAAIPGFIDFLYTVPPRSSAKKRGVKHALLNTTQLILFFIAWLARSNDNPNYIPVLILELAGVIIIGIAGWLGSTLIYRNQIAVDQRYAEAGKWKEEYLEPSKEKMKVATSDELKVNQMKLLHVGKMRIVIGRTENGYVAFEDRCTHKGGSLAGGAMICSTVQCPWHGSQFHVVTGQVKSGPANENIKTYPLSESNGNVYVKL